MSRSEKLQALADAHYEHDVANARIKWSRITVAAADAEVEEAMYGRELDRQIAFTEAWAAYVGWMDHRQMVLDKWVGCPGPMPITENQSFRIHSPDTGERGISFSRDELISTAKAHGKYSEAR